MASNAAIGTAPAKTSFDGSRFVLDAVFRHSALVLTDVASILFDLPFSIPVPLLGFTYEVPSSYTLLKYEYSEYPYLNKQSIISGYVKNNTELSIRSYRALTTNVGIVQAVAINTALMIAIEKYCDRGGRFALVNVYDALANNLVLEELKIIPSDTNRIDSIGLEWTFKKINFANNSLIGTLSSELSKLSGGFL